MDLRNDRPVRLMIAKSMKGLDGGNKGKLFLIETLAEKLVVKFQNETFSEATVGAHMLQIAGVNTPYVRAATPADLDSILQCISALGSTLIDEFKRFRGAFKNALLMEYAEGRTIGDIRKERVAEFLDVILDAEFQRELGRMMAGDVFSGNPDRMFAIKVGYQKGVGRQESTFRGWYHEKNIMVSGNSEARRYRPVAIDNAFSPQISRAAAPFGVRVEGAGFQIGSIACACARQGREEAGLIFTKFVESAIEDHQSLKDFISARVAGDHKERFVANFTAGAVDALKTLTQKGSKWKGQLEELGVDQKTIDLFRSRKRLLRKLVDLEEVDVAQIEEIVAAEVTLNKGLKKYAQTERPQ